MFHMSLLQSISVILHLIVLSSKSEKNLTLDMTFIFWLGPQRLRSEPRRDMREDSLPVIDCMMYVRVTLMLFDL